MIDFNLFIKMVNLALKSSNGNSLKLEKIVEICKKFNFKVEIGASLDEENLTSLEDYISNTDSLDIMASTVYDLQRVLNGDQIIFTNSDETSTVIFYQIDAGDN